MVPKLSCETFIRDYYPNRISIEALAHFPIEKDLVVDLSGFIEKLEHSAYIIPKEKRSIEQVNTSRRRQVQDYMQFTRHQRHASLCRLPSVWPEPRLHRSGRDGLCCTATTWILAMVRPSSGWNWSLEEGVFNCSAVGYCSGGLSETR